ncbi:hypothetical protein HYH03_005796 [Edaphochlamys debaryana]|nr:hypothetical protein HYH03_005796 [Edaphochlamys debaryana]|eukprot:KAG2496197.1 hypothetical protein HYH03_005796 [Edaphochlamys debaryana]
MDQRLQQLAQHAATRGVKLLLEDLDGPHLGPVLSALLPPLLRAVNSVGAEALAAGRPAAPAEARLFLPYAVGAAGALQRLTRDLETAQSEGYVLGAKLVGNGSDAPSTWSACLERLLEAAQAGRAEVMLAAARRGEVEAAVAALARAGLSPEAAPVAFVQPLGVADHLGFSLGRHGYRVYKTCPYGKAEDVRPALLQHMQDASWASHEDARLAQAELWSRLLSDPLAAAAARVLGARQQRSSAGASGGRSDANQPMAS